MVGTSKGAHAKKFNKAAAIMINSTSDDQVYSDCLKQTFERVGEAEVENAQMHSLDFAHGGGGITNATIDKFDAAVEYVAIGRW